MADAKAGEVTEVAQAKAEATAEAVVCACVSE